ncbi:MAG: cysteine peptidase family C39 domain-containing protein, partial [Candidatus Omnitrophica bacterium]|nr:cysteine peptidase family C39 domain-containing protein [Candidatus Omnitrophota bacterium]
MNDPLEQTDDGIVLEEEPKPKFRSNFKTWLRVVAFIVIAVFLPEQVAQAVEYDWRVIWGKPAVSPSNMYTPMLPGDLNALSIPSAVKSILLQISGKPITAIKLSETQIIELDKSINLSKERIEEIFNWLKGKPCGSKALYDYLRLKGAQVQEEDIAVLALTTDILNDVIKPEGSPEVIKNSLYALSRASESFGHKLYPVKLSAVSSQLSALPVPFIAHFNGDHYVLITRIADDKVYLLDNHQKSYISMEEFGSRSSSYALVTEISAGIRLVSDEEAKQVKGAGNYYQEKYEASKNNCSSPASSRPSSDYTPPSASSYSAQPISNYIPAAINPSWNANSNNINPASVNAGSTIYFNPSPVNVGNNGTITMNPSATLGTSLNSISLTGNQSLINGSVNYNTVSGTINPASFNNIPSDIDPARFNNIPSAINPSWNANSNFIAPMDPNVGSTITFNPSPVNIASSGMINVGPINTLGTSLNPISLTGNQSLINGSVNYNTVSGTINPASFNNSAGDIARGLVDIKPTKPNMGSTITFNPSPVNITSSGMINVNPINTLGTSLNPISLTADQSLINGSVAYNTVSGSINPATPGVFNSAMTMTGVELNNFGRVALSPSNAVIGTSTYYSPEWRSTLLASEPPKSGADGAVTLDTGATVIRREGVESVVNPMPGVGIPSGAKSGQVSAVTAMILDDSTATTVTSIKDGKVVPIMSGANSASSGGGGISDDGTVSSIQLDTGQVISLEKTPSGEVDGEAESAYRYGSEEGRIVPESKEIKTANGTLNIEITNNGEVSYKADNNGVGGSSYLRTCPNGDCSGNVSFTDALNSHAKLEFDTAGQSQGSLTIQSAEGKKEIQLDTTIRNVVLATPGEAQNLGIGINDWGRVVNIFDTKTGHGYGNASRAVEITRPESVLDVIKPISKEATSNPQVDAQAMNTLVHQGRVWEVAQNGQALEVAKGNPFIPANREIDDQYFKANIQGLTVGLQNGRVIGDLLDSSYHLIGGADANYIKIGDQSIPLTGVGNRLGIGSDGRWNGGEGIAAQVNGQMMVIPPGLNTSFQDVLGRTAAVSGGSDGNAVEPMKVYTSNARQDMSFIPGDSRVQLSGTLEFVRPIADNDWTKAAEKTIKGESYVISGGELLDNSFGIGAEARFTDQKHVFPMVKASDFAGEHILRGVAGEGVKFTVPTDINPYGMFGLSGKVPNYMVNLNDDLSRHYTNMKTTVQDVDKGNVNASVAFGYNWSPLSGQWNVLGKLSDVDKDNSRLYSGSKKEGTFSEAPITKVWSQGETWGLLASVENNTQGIIHDGVKLDKAYMPQRTQSIENGPSEKPQIKFDGYNLFVERNDGLAKQQLVRLGEGTQLPLVIGQDAKKNLIFQSGAGLPGTTLHVPEKATVGNSKQGDIISAIGVNPDGSTTRSFNGTTEGAVVMDYNSRHIDSKIVVGETAIDTKAWLKGDYQLAVDYKSARPSQWQFSPTESVSNIRALSPLSLNSGRHMIFENDSRLGIILNPDKKDNTPLGVNGDLMREVYRVPLMGASDGQIKPNPSKPGEHSGQQTAQQSGETTKDWFGRMQDIIAEPSADAANQRLVALAQGSDFPVILKETTDGKTIAVSGIGMANTRFTASSGTQVGDVILGTLEPAGKFVSTYTAEGTSVNDKGEGETVANLKHSYAGTAKDMLAVSAKGTLVYSGDGQWQQKMLMLQVVNPTEKDTPKASTPYERYKQAEAFLRLVQERRISPDNYKDRLPEGWSLKEVSSLDNPSSGAAKEKTYEICDQEGRVIERIVVHEYERIVKDTRLFDISRFIGMMEANLNNPKITPAEKLKIQEAIAGAQRNLRSLPEIPEARRYQETRVVSTEQVNSPGTAGQERRLYLENMGKDYGGGTVDVLKMIVHAGTGVFNTAGAGIAGLSYAFDQPSRNSTVNNWDRAKRNFSAAAHIIADHTDLRHYQKSYTAEDGALLAENGMTWLQVAPFAVATLATKNPEAGLVAGTETTSVLATLTGVGSQGLKLAATRTVWTTVGVGGGYVYNGLTSSDADRWKPGSKGALKAEVTGGLIMLGARPLYAALTPEAPAFGTSVVNSFKGMLKSAAIFESGLVGYDAGRAINSSLYGDTYHEAQPFTLQNSKGQFSLDWFRNNSHAYNVVRSLGGWDNNAEASKYFQQAGQRHIGQLDNKASSFVHGLADGTAGITTFTPNLFLNTRQTLSSLPELVPGIIETFDKNSAYAWGQITAFAFPAVKDGVQGFRAKGAPEGSLTIGDRFSNGITQGANSIGGVGEFFGQTIIAGHVRDFTSNPYVLMASEGLVAGKGFGLFADKAPAVKPTDESFNPAAFKALAEFSLGRPLTDQQLGIIRRAHQTGDGQILADPQAGLSPTDIGNLTRDGVCRPLVETPRAPDLSEFKAPEIPRAPETPRAPDLSEFKAPEIPRAP